MRIAIDARAAAETTAGRGRYVRELIKGLGRIDADHEFLLLARSSWSEAELDQRFKWTTFVAPSLVWPLLAGRRMSRSADVALACTSYAMTGLWAIPGAAIIWDFVPFDRALSPPRGSELERMTIRLAIRRCEALISISETTREELEARFHGASRKTTVAQPAADEIFSPIARADDEDVLRTLGIERPYVLVTGTLEPRKNLPRVIEAFTRLDERVRSGWTLALAGPAGWQTQSIESALAANRELVRALGHVSDHELACLYRNAEVFCYASLYEGFGIPVLEAMKSGTAVLTSDVSSMPEVGGQAARYVDPRDVEDIRRGLAELMGDQTLRASCAEAGKARAQEFDWTATSHKVLDVLERVAATAA
jgi:glycosyltransferase involved in cell wall biosynthesis